MEAVVLIIVLLVIAGITALGRSMKVVQQYEKGVLYRWGRVQPKVIEPGLSFIRPVGDRLQKVNMQIIAMTVPAQDGITRDNVSVRVDAVVYFRAANAPDDDAGHAYDGGDLAVTSAGDGLISVLLPAGGVRYKWRRGTEGPWVHFSTAQDAGDSFTIPSGVGSP